MCDTEQKREYFRRYYRNNKEKYKQLDNRETISKPPKRVNKKKTKKEPQFSIQRGKFLVKFQ